MEKIISIHEYTLKDDVDHRHFEGAVERARQLRLFDLPGLQTNYFLRRLRGTRNAAYAAVWIYESKDAWIKLWGEPENPKPKSDYPKNWKIWEEEILAPFLIQDPDRIFYAAYEEF